MRSLLNRIQKSYLLIAAGVLIAANIFTFAPAVFALTYLTKPEVIETNMNAAGASSLIIEFTTSASNTGTSLSVTFPAGYTVATGAMTYATTYTTANCTAITGATSDLPGAPAASGSGQVITFSGITAMTASHSYCGVLTGTVVTNPAAGVYVGSITAGTDAAAQIAWDVITNDQVVVTATVPASFTLVISSSTDPFTANLAVGTVGATTGVTATMTTNGTGWNLYGYDANAGLLSANTGHNIASTTPGTTATLTAGTEGYVTAINSTSTVTAAYANSGFATPGKGSGLNTTAIQLVSGTGPTAAATAVFREYAAISGTTPAASDYTDTITLLGAGTF
jgi:hypothetical protein